MSTRGHLEQKSEFGRTQSQGVDTPNCACPKVEVVKAPLFSSDQGEYIRTKVIPGATTCSIPFVADVPGTSCSNRRAGSNFIGTVRQTNHCNIMKPIGPVDYKTYMTTFLMKKKCLPIPTTGPLAPSPAWQINDSCAS